MQLVHILRALRAVTTREILKFVHQRGRLLSALVRPLMWLAVFAAGFYNVFGVSIIPPYKTYITYQVYIVPGLLGIILLFHGMQSSLSMVYDREMGVMRLLLTAPLPRWVLLACKLAAGTALSVITSPLDRMTAGSCSIGLTRAMSAAVTARPASPAAEGRSSSYRTAHRVVGAALSSSFG